MKLLKSLKDFRPERLLQLTAHPLYIILGLLFYYGLQRPFLYYPFLILTNFLFFVFLMSIANRFFKEKESLMTLTPIIIAGTLMLNLEAYDFRTYMIAGAISVFSRSFLKTKFGHIFNPGYFGTFVIAMLLPKYGYPSIGLWKSNIWLLILIFFLGCYIVYKAKRLRLVFGYIFSFVAIAIVTSIFLKIVGISFNGVEEVPVLFWPATLVSTSSAIFIFHVISDPKTSPSDAKAQIIFGACIATFDYLLRISLIIPAEAISYLFVQSGFAFYKIYLQKKI